MNPGAIFCQWLPLYLEKEVYKSVLRTLKGSFKYVTLWYLGHAAVIQIASNEEIKIDPLLIQSKIDRPAIKSRLKLVELDDAYTLLKCFLLDNEKSLHFSSDAAINFDDTPFVEFKVPLQSSSQIIFGENLLEMAPMRPAKPPFAFSVSNMSAEETNNKWNSFHLILRGSILHHIGKPEESMAAYLRAFEIDSSDKHARYFLGIGRGEHFSDRSNSLIKIGDYFKSKKLFDKSIYYYNLACFEDTISISALNSLSTVYFETGNFDKAIFTGEKALSIQPNNESLLYNLGTYYEEINKKEKAKELYSKCLAINPLFSYAKERLNSMQK